jgi:hypothetical protein
MTSYLQERHRFRPSSGGASSWLQQRGAFRQAAAPGGSYLQGVFRDAGIGITTPPPPPPPLGTPVLPVALKAANAINLTSTAFDPAANSLLFIALEARLTSTLAASTLSNNGSLSPTLIADLSHDSGSGNRVRQRIWAVVIDDTPPTGLTFTTTNGATCRQNLHFCSVPNGSAVPVATDVAGGTSAAGGVVATFDHVPAANSVLVSMCGGAAASATPVAPITGFTELEDAYDVTNGQMQCQVAYRAGTGAQANSFGTGALLQTCGSVIEVRQL